MPMTGPTSTSSWRSIDTLQPTGRSEAWAELLGFPATPRHTSPRHTSGPLFGSASSNATVAKTFPPNATPLFPEASAPRQPIFGDLEAARSLSWLGESPRDSAISAYPRSESASTSYNSFAARTQSESLFTVTPKQELPAEGRQHPASIPAVASQGQLQLRGSELRSPGGSKTRQQKESIRRGVSLSPVPSQAVLNHQVHRQAALDFVLELAGPLPEPAIEAPPTPEASSEGSVLVRPDDLPIAAFGVDRSMRVDMWNSEMAQLSGWKEAELLRESTSVNALLIPRSGNAGNSRSCKDALEKVLEDGGLPSCQQFWMKRRQRTSNPPTVSLGKSLGVDTGRQLPALAESAAKSAAESAAGQGCLPVELRLARRRDTFGAVCGVLCVVVPEGTPPALRSWPSAPEKGFLDAHAEEATEMPPTFQEWPSVLEKATLNAPALDTTGMPPSLRGWRSVPGKSIRDWRSPSSKGVGELIPSEQSQTAKLDTVVPEAPVSRGPSYTSGGSYNSGSTSRAWARTRSSPFVYAPSSPRKAPAMLFEGPSPPSEVVPASSLEASPSAQQPGSSATSQQPGRPRTHSSRPSLRRFVSAPLSMPSAAPELDRLRSPPPEAQVQSGPGGLSPGRRQEPGALAARALVVESAEGVRLELVENLERCGLNAAGCGSLLEAVQQFEQSLVGSHDAPCFDVIFLELQPNCDEPFLAIRDLRRLEEEARILPCSSPTRLPIMGIASRAKSLGDQALLQSKASVPAAASLAQEGIAPVVGKASGAPSAPTEVGLGKEAGVVGKSDSVTSQPPKREATTSEGWQASGHEGEADEVDRRCLILGVVNLNRWDLAGLDAAVDQCIRAGGNAVIPQSLHLQQLKVALRHLGVRSKYLTFPSRLPRALSGAVHNPLNITR